MADEPQEMHGNASDETAMTQDAALVLIAHGSPDPNWRAPIERLAERIKALQPGRTVAVCYMERATPTLADVVAGLTSRNVARAVVVPAFLSPGGRHIKRDLPQLVEEIGSRYAELALSLVPGALGADEEVIEALARATLRAAFRLTERCQKATESAGHCL